MNCLKKLIIVTILLTFSILFAGNYKLLVKNFPDSVQVNRLITFSVLMENPYEQDLYLQSQLKVPETWQTYNKDQEFSLKSKQKTFKLCSFKIPSKARAGIYHITFVLSNSASKMPMDSVSITINLPKIKDIEIVSEPIQKILLSGDTLLVTLNAQNRGNISAQLKLAKTDNRIYTLLNPQEVTIAPVSDRKIKLYYKINENLNQSQKLFLQIPVLVDYLDKSETHQYVNLNSEIIPLKVNNDDLYNRLDLSGRNALSYSNHKSYNSLSLNANSFIDAYRKYEMRLAYQNNEFNDKVFNRNTRASILLNSKSMQMGYGDSNSSIESALLPSVSGRGEFVALNSNYLRLRAYRLQDQASYKSSYISSLYFRPWRYSTHSLNFAYADSANSIRSSIKTNFKLFSKIIFDTEFAYKSDKAFKHISDAENVAFTFSNASFHLYNNFTYIPCKFSEMDTRKTLNNTRLSFLLFNKNLDITHDFEDIMVQNKYKETSSSLYLNVPLTHNFTERINLQRQEYEIYSRDKNTVSLGNEWTYVYYYKSYDFKHTGSLYYKIDDEQDINTLSQVYAVEAIIHNYKPHKISSLVQWRREALPSSSVYANIVTSSFSLDYLVNERLNFSSSITYSNYLNIRKEWSFNNQNSLTYSINKNVNLVNSLNYRLNPDNLMWSCSSNISVNSGFAIQERRDVLRLRGRVLNASNEVVKNKILILDNRFAITDNEGFFTFSGLKQGSYTLDTYGKDSKIYRPALPLIIAMKADSLANLDIIQLPAGKVFGSINYLKAEENWYLKKEINYVLVSPVSGVRLLCFQDSKVYETYTDSAGKYSFEELGPGKCLIKIDIETLPVNCNYEWTEKELVLGVGSEYFLNLDLKERLKKVKYKKIGE